jgi:hypothetical protein
MTQQFAKMSLEEAPISKVNLESLPIKVWLYKSGAAKANVILAGRVYTVERNAFPEISVTVGLTQYQTLTMQLAIESAFKKSNFRGDLVTIKTSEKILHSKWQVTGNTATKLNQ